MPWYQHVWNAGSSLRGSLLCTSNFSDPKWWSKNFCLSDKDALLSAGWDFEYSRCWDYLPLSNLSPKQSYIGLMAWLFHFFRFQSSSWTDAFGRPGRPFFPSLQVESRRQLENRILKGGSARGGSLPYGFELPFFKVSCPKPWAILLWLNSVIPKNYACSRKSNHRIGTWNSPKYTWTSSEIAGVSHLQFFSMIFLQEKNLQFHDKLGTERPKVTLSQTNIAPDK